MTAGDPIGTTVLLNSGVRATVLERIERAGGAVYLLRVVEEDARVTTMLTVPVSELPSMEVVDVPASLPEASPL